MAKAVIKIGYKDFLVDAKDALTIMEILDKAEVWEEKWQSREDGGTMYFAYPQSNEDSVRTIQIIPDSLHKMAKLAGKPES